MSLVSQHIVGSESFFSKTSGIGGKLRKKSEYFNVEEVVSIPGRSHWIWMQDTPNGKHQIVKIKAKNWDTHVLMKELSRSCLLYTSPSPRDVEESRMPSSA